MDKEKIYKITTDKGDVYFDKYWNYLTHAEARRYGRLSKIIHKLKVLDKYQLFSVAENYDNTKSMVAVTPLQTIYKIKNPYTGPKDIQIFCTIDNVFKNPSQDEISNNTLESIKIFEDSIFIGRGALGDGRGLTMGSDYVYIGDHLNYVKNGNGISTRRYCDNNIVKDELSGVMYMNVFVDEYIGEWKNGKKQGHGTMSTHDMSYEGLWNDDKMNEKGEISYKNHDYYGEWQNGISKPRTQFKQTQNVIYTNIYGVGNDIPNITKYTRNKIENANELNSLDLKTFITQKWKLKIEIEANCNKDGDIINEKKITDLINEITKKTILQNKSDADNNIKQINLNLIASHGSAWLNNKGFKIIQKASNEIGIPIKITACQEDMSVSEFITNGKIFMPHSEEISNIESNEFIVIPEVKNKLYINNYINKHINSGYQKYDGMLKRVKSWHNTWDFVSSTKGNIIKIGQSI